MTAMTVQPVGPAPNGGTEMSITSRRLFANMTLLPDRLTEITLAVDECARIRGWPVPVTVLTSPALARQLLTRPTGIRRGRGSDALKGVLGNGLLTSDGELHRRQRRLVQPVFHTARLRTYATAAVLLADRWAGQWRDGQRIDVAAEMSTLTLEFVGRTLFGADVRGEAEIVARAQTRLIDSFPRMLTPIGQLALRLPTPLHFRIRGTIATLDGVVERVIAARAGGASGVDASGADAGGDAGDVVSLLLAVRDEDTGEAMPHRQVRDEVLTLLLAGHETTSVALSWAWYELSRHPEARSALDVELARPDARSALDAAAWDRLPYTRAVIAETMRLHPPAYVLGRRAGEDIDLGGYPMREGSVIIASPYALHRDPRSWGPDALAFRPERWLDASGAFDEAAPGQPRGAYLPFGAGSRMCIGAGFAVMEAVLLLARLASSWRVEIDPTLEVRPQPAVTLRPKGGIPATLRAV